jgi:hypothetical protein
LVGYGHAVIVVEVLVETLAAVGVELDAVCGYGGDEGRGGEERGDEAH